MTAEDIWFNIDGKTILFTSKVYEHVSGDLIRIPEFNIIHRAVVQVENPRYTVSVASISGNTIKLSITDVISSQIVSGTVLSGSKIDIVAAGA